MFDKHLEETLNHAIELAHRQNCEFITVEHLLYALLDNSDVQTVFQFYTLDCDKLKKEIHQYIQINTPSLNKDTRLSATPTLAFQRVLQRALFVTQNQTQQKVSGFDVLISILSEENSYALYLLAKHGIEQHDVLSHIESFSQSKKVHKPLIFRLEQIDEEEENIQNGKDAHFYAHKSKHKSDDALDLFTVNLNEKARRGEIDPLIGRENEMQRTIQILHRRHKNNPLYVGDAGVGKTALAEGLALKIFNKEVPKRLHEATIYSLNLSSLVAGTRYRGDFEERFKDMFDVLNKKPYAILFIDEIHTVIGTGSTNHSLDASNMLKPLLTSNQVVCIGSTTYKEFRNIFEKDHALARRFQKIDVVEPSNSEALKILQGLKSRFEDFHQSKYTPNALRSAVELSARYLHDRSLPDKAIDIIDEAGAYMNLHSAPSKKDKKNSSKTIRTKDIEKAVAQIAKIPLQQISQDELGLLNQLEQNLKMQIFGQNDAIGKIAGAIKMSRSGMSEEAKPIGSFLLTGPTGVGKTELVKQLAQLTNMTLLRFDMSEYMERHSVSRLIGAPPGYVGYDQGGLLTDSVLKTPYAVLLLDEIEKAHGDVFNLLLQIMDYGKLTDTSGRKVDFCNVILIMTSNLGSSDMNKAVIGFANDKKALEQGGSQAAKQFFMPEFRNRLDAIIPFKSLNEEMILLIVDKFIAQLQVQMEQKNISLKVSPSLRQWIARKGFDEQLGARPVQRFINEHLKKAIVNELLRKRLKKGSIVYYTVKNDKPVFTLRKPQKKPAKNLALDVQD